MGAWEPGSLGAWELGKAWGRPEKLGAGELGVGEPGSHVGKALLVRRKTFFVVRITSAKRNQFSFWKHYF